jgi:hypothetical protein
MLRLQDVADSKSLVTYRQVPAGRNAAAAYWEANPLGMEVEIRDTKRHVALKQVFH